MFETIIINSKSYANKRPIETYQVKVAKVNVEASAKLNFQLQVSLKNFASK